MRTCGFDGKQCINELRCRANGECGREVELEKAGVCTVCEPPRRFHNQRALQTHRQMHAEQVPCPKGCGKQLKPGGVTRHLQRCGLVESMRRHPSSQPVERTLELQRGRVAVTAQIRSEVQWHRLETDELTLIAKLLEMEHAQQEDAIRQASQDVREASAQGNAEVDGGSNCQ